MKRPLRAGSLPPQASANTSESTSSPRFPRQRGSTVHRRQSAARRQIESHLRDEGEVEFPQLRRPPEFVSQLRRCRAMRKEEKSIPRKLQNERHLIVDPMWDERLGDCAWLKNSSLEEDDAKMSVSRPDSRRLRAKAGLSPLIIQSVHVQRTNTPMANDSRPEPAKFTAAGKRPPRSACRGGAQGPAENEQRMLEQLPTLAGVSLDDLLPHLRFGPAAFGPMTTTDVQMRDCASAGSIVSMLEESVDGVERMRGQRGERFVTEMMSSWTTQGLFMHGAPDSPVNRFVIPAAKHIFACMADLPSNSPKRMDHLKTLALACQDCQQVQAREIMRIFGDLTSQCATLDQQLKYSLIRQKEAALNCIISQRHPRCDLDHTKVQPWQQRVHLFSGYVSIIGEAIGFDSVTAAKSDRFLSQANHEIGKLDEAALVKQLRSGMSVKEWLQCLLADINNQAEVADRLIDRGCIFKWVRTHMSDAAAYLVFYDEDRSEEFVGQYPKQPSPANQFEPFLSSKVLVQILLKAGMLTWR